MQSSEARLEVQKLNELPAMSLVVQQFLEALNDNSMEVRQLARMIEQDPSLSARLVGLANSAYYGQTIPITTIEDAIFKVLGLNTAKNIALGIVLAGPFNAARCPAFQAERHWAVAMATAILAQRLATAMLPEERPTPGEAYLCGLVGNLGLLALIHLYPQAMQGVLQQASGCDIRHIAELEHNMLGFDHFQVGGWLARKWRLPGHVVAVMEHRLHSTYEGPHWPLVRLIEYTSHWAEKIFCEEDKQHEAIEMPKVLGLDAQRVQQAVDSLSGKLDEIRTIATVLAKGK